MEVTRADFERDDGKLLKEFRAAVADAEFVAVDLEFSGVQRRTNTGGGIPTVQERYSLLKEGAEKFQVLQLGICVVSWDAAEGAYVCRPYTFPVCPVTESKWHMDREYTYQSSAIRFLSDNQFDFNLLFSQGIPYLNPEEERTVRKREEKAISGVMEDIIIDDSQKDFLNEAVTEVQKWIDDPNPEFDFVNITGPNNEINGYQKRLVHQVVRAKFPALVTLSRNNFIQVICRDEEQEAVHLKEKQERSDANIARGDQVGLRHVIDTLRERGVPVVGHNLIGDLMHIYCTFVGTLPSTVETFAAMVHKDFPIVCDTKYISTISGPSSGAASNLQTLFETLSSLQNPPITLHTSHSSGITSHHNAGYDALVTAKVLLRLMTVYQTLRSSPAEGPAGLRLALFVNQKRRFSEEGEKAPDGEFLLPGWGDVVWDGLTNRLRVNGTEEMVVMLKEEGGGQVGGGGG